MLQLYEGCLHMDAQEYSDIMDLLDGNPWNERWGTDPVKYMGDNLDDV